MLLCPRCKTALTSTEQKQGELHYCDQCGGSLLSHAIVGDVLDGLLPDLIEEFSNDPQFPVLPDETGSAACPRCQQVMHKHGYLEQDKVMIDSCLPCGLVWTDPGELAVMACMRSASFQASREDLERHTALIAEQDEAGRHGKLLRMILRTWRTF